MDPLVERPRFRVAADGTRAGSPRAGLLETPHGVLSTPTFFPVATHAAVRGITPEELRRVGVQGVLANTYHLHLRPGEEIVARLGGLSRFMGWEGPTLTDSGGFQIYSLDHLCERSEEGVRFKTAIDGSGRFLSPEGAVEIQEALGADLIVVLDEFESIGTTSDDETRARVGAMMERTLRWAERGRGAQRRDDQLLFGIVQGGGFEDLRAESAGRTAALGFDAFAIGGLGVGESPEAREPLLRAALEPLPETAPRYLMGLGSPDDLVAAVALGIDLFDCVVPTRNGRHGNVFTREGTLNLRNARFRGDPGPIDEGCTCPACGSFSRGYLRHLLAAGEALGPRLLALHNLAHYMNLLQEMREAIVGGGFDAWRREWEAGRAR